MDYATEAVNGFMIVLLIVGTGIMVGLFLRLSEYLANRFGPGPGTWP